MLLVDVLHPGKNLYESAQTIAHRSARSSHTYRPLKRAQWVPPSSRRLFCWKIFWLRIHGDVIEFQEIRRV